MFYQIAPDVIINLEAIDTVRIHSYVSGGGPKKEGTKEWEVILGLRQESLSFTFEEERAAQVMFDILTAMLVDEGNNE